MVGTTLGVLLATAEAGWLLPGGGASPNIAATSTITTDPPQATMLDQFDLSGLTIPKDEILAGGPPKDGIPSLTDPETTVASEAEFLEPNDRVVAVTVNDEHRAYPVRLLNWHEIVNDTLGGKAIAVVYCPLCDSVSVVERRIDGETLEFGVSGLLYQSNVLMYDRQHDGLWSQILLESVSGPHAGRSLKHRQWTITTFGPWSDDHPQGSVVTFATGHGRDYDTSPYDEYLTNDDLWMPVKREDERLDRKTRVIGVRYGEITRAYPIQAVHESSDQRLIDEIDGKRIVINAIMDTGRVQVVDAPEETRVIHTFWFSWAAAHPETEIYDGS